MSMLHRAGIPYAMDRDLAWLETAEVRFFFLDSGKKLRAIVASDPYTSAVDAMALLPEP